MKIFVASLLIASTGLSAIAQDSAAPTPAVKARVVAELAAAAQKGAIKNSPLSADEVNESVQTLADGNRIVRSSIGKFYRNGEGRVRRDMSGGTGGVLGTTFSFSPGVSIVNPGLGQKYLLDSELKTARVIELAQAQKGLTIEGLKGSYDAERAKLDRAHTEQLRSTRPGEVISPAGTRLIAPMPAMPAIPSVPAVPAMIAPGQGSFAYTVGPESKYESHTEELGSRDFEGVTAEGTRRTTTIPAGAIGNDRPIEIVYERWFSKDLGLVVYSKNSDPRFGEQTYKLTNIVRSEPDPSLFSVPTEYRKVDGSGTVYRVSTQPAAVRKAIAARPVVNTGAKARP